MNKILIIIGLPGSGKTSALRNLSRRRDIATLDFDQAMPEGLRAKMKSGMVITDDEREVFFSEVIQELKKLAQNKPVVAACVLVKEKHRKMFLEALPSAVIVRLEVPLPTLMQRIQKRQHAFFSPKALEALAQQDEKSALIFEELDGTIPEKDVVEALEKILN